MALVAALTGVLLAACSPGADQEPTQNGGRTVHGFGDGPLEVAGAGGNSILAPRTVPWVATFGWANPCTTTGEPITIDRVRYEFTVRPIRVRMVAFEAKRYHGSTGFGSTKGTPEDNLRGGEYRGEILGPVEGLVVTDPCSQVEADRVLQLLTVLDVGTEGAEIPHYEVDYTTEGEKYTLRVNFQMVACGSQTSPDMCPDHEAG